MVREVGAKKIYHLVFLVKVAVIVMDDGEICRITRN